MNRLDFERILEAVSRGDDLEGASAARSFANRLNRAAAPVDVSAQATYDDLKRSEGDLEDVRPRGAAEDRQAEPPVPGLNDVGDVERELGLKDEMSLADLKRRRREYLWRHHPDRAGSDRTIATKRAAIANMLFDRAIRKRSSSA